MSITPLAKLRVTRTQIPAHERFPNTAIQQRPLLIYHDVFSAPSAATIEAHLTDVGAALPQWRYTMYVTSHFHSMTHEVLGVARGRARLCFGGEDNPGRAEPEVRAGDLLVVPAGVAHRLREDVDGGFEMVGAYPAGRAWDMCYGKKCEEEKVEGIAKLPWFDRDPVYGDEGPVFGAGEGES